MCCRLFVYAAVLASMVCPAVAMSEESPQARADSVDGRLTSADLFYLHGDYYRAISVYQGLLHERPDDARAPSIVLKMAWIYHVAGKPEAASHLLRNIARTQAEETLGWWARLWLADLSLIHI